MFNHGQLARPPSGEAVNHYTFRHPLLGGLLQFYQVLQSCLESPILRQHCSIFFAQGFPDLLDFLLHRQPAARFLGVSPLLVYAYVERKQIPHYRMMGRSIRFRLSELVEWRQQFHVNGGIDEQDR